MKKRETISLFIVFLLAIGLWFLPHSPEIPEKGWRIFSIFVPTILGIILKPLPIGALSIISLAAATLTGTLTLEETLGGFHNDIVWLVVFAFFIARGIIKTGLGTRVAYTFVYLFGKKSLGLSYSLLGSELILTPAIPSVTARTGGIIYPIILGLARSFGSDPKHHTERLIGSFLMKVAYQGSAITSAMFMTGMAANSLVVSLTRDAGYQVSWGMWALAACVPGILSLIVMPLIVYKFYPPTLKDTPNAPVLAAEKLKEMGPIGKKEGLMIFVFVLLMVMWIFGGLLCIKATVAALVGLALLLLFRILDWHDVTREESAWDTFIWFSTLIMLATQLNKHGFIPWLSEQFVGMVAGFPWMIAFVFLVLVYFYSHYFFALNSAHVGAMYTAFLMVIIGLGTPPAYAIAALGFTTSLCGGLTHYGSGPAPIYYGSGYVDIKTWWKLGFIISVANLVIWLGLGSLWWKIIGLY